MDRLLRKDREPSLDMIDSNIKDIRQQLSDQLRQLDSRLDNHMSMLSELQDFYKRRAEVEVEYSRSLDKMIKQIMSRHKAEKQKRETWPGYSTYTIWQTLLSTTRKVSKDRGVLGELYSAQIYTKLSELTEDVQRIYKRCREMAVSCHDDLLRVLCELQSSMKTYHLYHGDCLQAEVKLRAAESQLSKVEQLIAANKTGFSRKLRNFEKQTEKKQLKYAESRLRAVKARNEYLLCLEAANAAVQKYFNDDLQELINTMDYGYHNTVAQSILTHISADESLIQAQQGCVDLFNQRLRGLDQRVDKQTFIESFAQSFTAPAFFEFQSHRGDEECRLSVEKSLQEDLLDRLNAINDRLNNLRVENDEIWKTLETTDSSLLDLICSAGDQDVSRMFQDDGAPHTPRSAQDRDKRRADRLETEDFYLTKFRAYQISNNLIARLQAKHDCIEKTLTDNHCFNSNTRPARSCSAPVRPRRNKTLGGKNLLIGIPRLFGGTIQEYVEATGEDIPLIVRSCIRIINLYGMHHQGVFRVSGSQHEINEFKSQFERGKDPIPDKVDGKDINSIAGVLKLYFRELKEPLFPASMFDTLIQFISNYSFNDRERISSSVAHLRELLTTEIPRPVLIVMRYLFAFLNHLSEFSDENMMEPYNLAICFGPTLLPVPADRDLVLYQGHVNELMKNIIIHQEDIFPYDGGTVYERCIAEVVSDRREDMLDNLSEDEDMTGDALSEEEQEGREAEAMFDYSGRTERELSFKKGERLIVFEKVSNDWWEGAANHREGLLPDKYISVKTTNQLADQSSAVVLHAKDRSDDKSKSSESLRMKSLSLSVHLSDNLSDDQALSPSVRSNISLTTAEHAAPAVRSTKHSEPVHLNSSKSPSVHRRSCSPQPKPRLSLISQTSRQTSEDEGEGGGGGGGVVGRGDSSTSSSSCTADNDSSTSQSLLSFPGGGVGGGISPVCSDEERKLNWRTADTSSGVSPVPSDKRCISSNVDPDAHKTTEDLAMDIDSALAEVMSGIQALGKTHGFELDTSPPPTDSGGVTRGRSGARGSLDSILKVVESSPRDLDSMSRSIAPTNRSAEPRVVVTTSKYSDGGGVVDRRVGGGGFKRTPDLVVDLPLSYIQAHSPPTNMEPRESMTVGRQLTTAEVFANVNQSTIKKGTSSSSSGFSSVGTGKSVSDDLQSPSDVKNKSEKSGRGGSTGNDDNEINLRMKSQVCEQPAKSVDSRAGSESYGRRSTGEALSRSKSVNRDTSSSSTSNEKVVPTYKQSDVPLAIFRESRVRDRFSDPPPPSAVPVGSPWSTFTPRSGVGGGGGTGTGVGGILLRSSAGNDDYEDTGRHLPYVDVRRSYSPGDTGVDRSSPPDKPTRTTSVDKSRRSYSPATSWTGTLEDRGFMDQSPRIPFQPREQIFTEQPIVQKPRAITREQFFAEQTMQHVIIPHEQIFTEQSTMPRERLVRPSGLDHSISVIEEPVSQASLASLTCTLPRASSTSTADRREKPAIKAKPPLLKKPLRGMEGGVGGVGACGGEAKELETLITGQSQRSPRI